MSYDVMRLMSNACRGAIIAPPGKKLVISDLSNIEGRIQAWIAGEEWKLQAFRDFDAGKGHDLYALDYAKSFGVTPESVMEDKRRGGKQRQIGKVMALALGYEGGVGAFITMALAYGIDLEWLANEMFGIVLPVCSDNRLEAARIYEWALKNDRTYGLTKAAYMVCEGLKARWRNAHPAIEKFWDEIESAIKLAIADPERVIQVGLHVRVVRNRDWLRIILPSGRSLCYASPRFDEGKVTYMGINQYTRKWQRLTSYGGKFFENICQAVARDIMAHNMLVIENG